MKTVHNCNPCERDNAILPGSNWCSECEEALCDECHTFHRKGKTTRNHHVVNISNINNVPKIEIPKCTKHDLDEDFFCVGHDTLCCRQCMAEEHRICEKVMSMETASHDIRSSSLLHSTQKELDKIVKAFYTLTAKAQEQLLFTEKKRHEIYDEIENKRSFLHQEIDEAANKSKTQLETQYVEVHQNLFKQGKTFCNVLEKFDKDKNSLQEAVKHGSEHQVFILTQNLKKLIKEGTQKVNESNLIIDEISYDESKTASISIGEVNRTTKTFSANIGSVEPQVRVEDRAFEKRRLHFKSYLEMPRNCVNIRGMARTEDGALFLCNYVSSDACVFCFSDTNEFRSACKLGSRPFNICVIAEKKEAVCTLPDVNKLAVIDTDEVALKRTVTLKGKYPWGIALSPSEIIVGLFNKIEILSKEYVSLTSIELDISESNSVNFIQCSIDERLYVSCWNFQAVTLRGKPIFHLDAKIGDRANGISTDPAGNIYVAFSNSRIARLSKDGLVQNDNILDKDCGALWDVVFDSDYGQSYVVTEGGKQVGIFEFK